MTTYRRLIRQKRAKGFLDKEELRSLREVRHVEFARRYSALYGLGLPGRRLVQLGCAINAAVKPITRSRHTAA